MLLIRGLHNLRAEHRGCVATIGNFDGVHLGHQALFGELIQRARRQGLPALVIIFEPQPMEYFQPERAPPRLTRLREKLEAIEACGIDRVLLIRFDTAFAAVEAESFVRDVLIDRLSIRHLFVGDDFRFGRSRIGDFDLLQTIGRETGFGVESLATVVEDGERVSSTRIRKALQCGDLRLAARCLGRKYRICGRVAHGRQLGRTIGFPTLNIRLLRRSTPLRGVFAVQVLGIDSAAALPGVANIGQRPTVEDDGRFLLEVYLFDLSADLYGCHVQVEFIEYIREERRFESLEAMRVQIELDAKRAREIHRVGERACSQSS